MNPQSKVALVTGAARGIGFGISHSLVKAGVNVALVDVDAKAVAAAAAELNGSAIGFVADAGDENSMADAAARAARHFGGLDVMVNNAGGVRLDRPAGFGGMGNPFTRVTQEGWDEQIQTNLRTVFAGSKAVIPHLEQRGGGSIVNIASVAGLLPVANTPAYGAAKAGVLSLTRTLALELAPRQIRVNAICPGLVWTRAWEMLATLMKGSVPALKALEPRQIFLETVKRQVPMGAEQTIEDIGSLTAFLVSDASRNITGQTISVDGGLTLKIGQG